MMIISTLMAIMVVIITFDDFSSWGSCVRAVAAIVRSACGFAQK